jgi:hypothetical protein
MKLSPRSSPSQHVYDVIVLGHQFAGLWSAALLAKRGIKVLVVISPNAFTYSASGKLFPKQASLWPSVAASSVLGQLLQELQMNAALAKSSRAANIQVLEPDEWFSAYAHNEQDVSDTPSHLLLQSQAEQFREQSLLTDEFWKSIPALPPEGFFERFRSKPLFEQANRSLAPSDAVHPLHRALGWLSAPADGRQGLPLRPLSQWLSKPLYLDRRQAHPAGLHLERLQQLGVEIVESQLASLTLNGKQVVGVQLPKQDVTLRGSRVLLAMDSHEVATLFPENKQAAVPLLPFPNEVLTHHCLLPKRAIPRGLAEWACVVPANSSSAVVLVEHTPWNDPDQVLLSLRTTVPSELRRQGNQAIEAFVQQLRDQVATIMPFTLSQSIAQSTDLIDCPAHTALPLFHAPLPSGSALTGLTIASPFKNCLFVNRQVLPGLGLEGEAVVARRVAARCSEQLARKK